MALAGDVIELGSGAARVRVQGLGKTLRALERAGAQAEDMRDLMHQLGTIVGSAAATLAPRASGALAGTIRPGRGKTKAVIRAGRATVPYAGVQHYGWPARNIEPHPFLSTALQATRPAVLAALDAGLADLLRRADLT